jgi:hypothetical protein
MDLGCFRAAIVHRDFDEQIFRRFLRVLHEHIEVTVLIEHAGIEQLVLHLVPIAPAIGLDEIGIRKTCLRILVQYFMYEWVGVLSR